MTSLLAISSTSLTATGFQIAVVDPPIEPEMSRAKERDSIMHWGKVSNFGVVVVVDLTLIVASEIIIIV